MKLKKLDFFSKHSRHRVHLVLQFGDDGLSSLLRKCSKE